MKEINITEADIVVVAAWIVERREHISNFGTSEEDLRPPAIKVIHCILSLRANYDRVVKPRLDFFRDKHPNIKRIKDLANLITSYPTPYTFIQQELDYNSERKAGILHSVVKFVSNIIEEPSTVPEEETLKQWALHAKPQDCYNLRIKYFKLAGFQYLRMLFGADTVKPDVHIIRCLSELLSRNISPIESIYVLETASRNAGLSARSVDKYIWNRGARSRKDTTNTKLVRLDPDIVDAFPNEEAVNQALRSVLEEKNKKKR